jgi:hypothetical protein
VRRRQVEQGQGQLRERSAVQDWEAVVAASEELAALDPAAADPDGLASAAREQITRRQEAEKAAAARRRREAAAARRRQEAERKAREEAERKAREEAERKAREEAERKAREKAERKAREKAERKAREKAERKAREKAARKARDEDFLRFTTQLLSLRNANLREYSGRPGVRHAFPSDIRGELLSALDKELTRAEVFVKFSALNNQPTKAEVLVNLSAVESIDINLSDTSRVTKKTCSSTDSAPGPLFGTESTARGLLAITDKRLILAFAGSPEIPDSDRGSLHIYDRFRLADPVVPINPAAKGTDFVISQLEISYREISKVEEVRSQSRSYGLTGPRMVLSLSLTKFSLDRTFSLPTTGSLSLSFYGLEARQRGTEILSYIRRARGELSL